MPVAEIGPLAVIGGGRRDRPALPYRPAAVIGDGVVLGADCRIGAHATLSHALLGAAWCVLPRCPHRPGRLWLRHRRWMDFVSVPQLGRVVLEDDVEVGANTTIDRGSAHDTVIGAGHAPRQSGADRAQRPPGRGCVIVAQAGIAGSTIWETMSWSRGQAGLTGHLRIGRRARIGAQAGVMADVPAGTDVVGSPPSRCGNSSAIGTVRRLVRSAARRPGDTEGTRPPRRRQTRTERHGRSTTSTAEAASPATTIEVVDIARIMHAIPHRYPFLMIDRVVDWCATIPRSASRTSRSTRLSSRGISRITR